MATATLIPIDEYLATTYKPDRDYVDGELEERHLGEQSHNLIQTMLLIIFGQHRREWKVRPIAEQRIQVLPTRFRIPEVCLVPASEPVDEILHRPPLRCVDVLSEEDRFRRVMVGVEEYLAFGVPHVWIIEPRTREIWTVGTDGKPVRFLEKELVLPGTPVRVSVQEIFALIDEAPQE